MSRFYGAIGYATTTENPPGVWKESYTERMYPGELMRDSRSLRSGANRNDDIDISNIVSIVADPFAYENFHSIRYVKFMNSKWKVSSVEVEYPRLKLTLGGLFHDGIEEEEEANGNETGTS